MGNQILTDVKITRKALQILHNKLTFVGTINRQYDDSFAQEGAKIGNSLKIRLPNQYTVRTGQVAQIQQTQEQSVTLTVATQKGVDVNFTSQDLLMSLDDFSDRIIEPAMAVLAASIEADVFNVYASVYQQAGTAGANPSDITAFLNAKTLMNRSLTPKGDERYVQVNSAVSAAMVGGLKTLYEDSKSIGKQYLEGRMFKTAGFNFFENELVPFQTNATWTGTPVVYGAGQTGATLATSGWTATTDQIAAGTVFTVPGCYMVHPETKVSYGALQQFVCTATTTADANGRMTIPISPSITIAGAYQNTSAAPTNSGALTITGSSATAYSQSLAYHRDFATFVTADLPLYKGMDMAAREVYDGISIRLLKGYDIINDVQISRLDVLYGYLAMRPQLACRITS
jgi:hypothetical protein